MKIECKIRRKDGSSVAIGEQMYRFLPDESGRHVAEVDDEAHIDILLANGAFCAADEAPAGEGVKKERKPRKQRANADEAPAGDGEGKAEE